MLVDESENVTLETEGVSNFGRKLIVNVRLRQIISEHGSSLVEYEFSTQEQVNVTIFYFIVDIQE